MNGTGEKPTATFMCRLGCCAGCQDCYGMSIGCHQSPCRCDRPCTCSYLDEDEDPKWRDGCERHDESEDGRYDDRFQEPDDGLGDLADRLNVVFGGAPCPECGSEGACATDDEGRALIHVLSADDEEMS